MNRRKRRRRKRRRKRRRRRRRRWQREIFHLLFHSSDAFNSQIWAKFKSGSQNLISG